jgi:hypothetical protein
MSPFTLPRRLRLVRLLHAKGFRDAERLREDELEAALKRLDTLSSTASLARGKSGPSSSEKMARTEDVNTIDWRALYDDPDALPRFREPKIFLPEGDRTFLRLVAVDAERVFATWDLDAAARALVSHGAKLELHVLDDDRPATVHDVDTRVGGWYIDAPGERLAVLARLVTPDGTVVVESNPAIVPANRPAPPGPLVFATLPPFVDRRMLAHGPLLDGTELPKGIVRTERGVSEAKIVVEEPHRSDDEDAPSSAERARARAAGGGPGLPSSMTSMRPSSSTHASRGGVS